VIEALKAASYPRMENPGRGTGKRAGNGKPRPHHPVGKLRCVNLVSAAAREPWWRDQVGIKPSGGPNPGDGSSRAARPGEDRPDRRRCGDAKPQESHRGRTQPTRRPASEDSKGRPNARKDAVPGERIRDVRRGCRNLAEATRSFFRVSPPQGWMTTLATILESRADAARGVNS
jgi:hypothetical protein